MVPACCSNAGDDAVADDGHIKEDFAIVQWLKRRVRACIAQLRITNRPASVDPCGDPLSNASQVELACSYSNELWNFNIAKITGPWS